MYAPEHPLAQLTTGELRTYRLQLERAVAQLAEVPVAAELRGRLDAVRAEEASRANIVAATRVPRIDPNEHYSA